jgi:hypothetical protein
MKQLKTKIIVLAIATVAGGIVCSVRNENAYFAVIAIAVAATYGGIAISIKTKSA